MPRRYNYRHQQTREHWRPIIAAGNGWCAEPICLLPTRHIPPEWAPTQLWHISHDPTGTIVIGPSHRRCNLAEAARRGNRMRTKPPKQPPTAGRWLL